MEQLTHLGLLEALTRLNEIGEAINDLGAENLSEIAIGTVLENIVVSATELVPGSSAVLYTYDEPRRAFNPASRVSEEGLSNPPTDDAPRPHGIGFRAVNERRRVLAYEEPDLEIHPSKVALGAKTMVASPLIVAREILGVLYLYLVEDRPLSELELLMLDNFVNQAAMTLSLARQLELSKAEQDNKGRELRRLRRAGMLIASRFGLQATLRTILEMALEVMDANYGIFRLVDKSGQYLVAQAYFGENLEAPVIEKMPINESSIMGYVAVRQEPVVISDLWELPWRDIYHPLDPEIEMRSEVAVPLIGASGRLEGVLNLESPQINAFDKQDRYILQILATQAVSAIQEVRLLDALQEITMLLLGQSRQVVLRYLVAKACDLLNTSVGLIWLLDGEELVLQACTEEPLEGERLSVEDSLTGLAVLEGLPVYSKSLADDTRFTRKDLAESRGWNSALIVPLIAAGDATIRGALGVYTGQPDQRDFSDSEWDKKVVTILAQYAALAVLNAAQVEALRTAQERHALAETFAAVGDMAANLMHRFNNKVGTIPVRVDGMLEKHPGALEQLPYVSHNLQEIRLSALDAIEIVRESLMHLRPIHLTQVSLQACLGKALALSAFPPDVRIEVEGFEGLQPIEADEQRLTLVFSNLLENARDAMRGQGEIRVRAGLERDGVQLVVQDTGPGIPPEMQEQIFDFSYSNSAQHHPGKLGFGLWWVKTQMVRMGGKISVESDGQHGTAFLLWFPGTAIGD